MPSLEKELMLEEIVKTVKGKEYVFISQFNKLNVSDINDIRRKVEKSSLRSIVAKKTLARKVFQQIGIAEAEKLLDGSVFITVAEKDPQIVSKILIDFTKDKEGFQVQGAYIEGGVYGKDYLGQLAKLPSREVLIATVVRGVAAPVQGFVNCLSQMTRSLVVVLDQIQKQKASAG